MERRLRDLREALVRLSSGDKRMRKDLFDDSGATESSWQCAFLRRLVDAELVIRHGAHSNDPKTSYEAVDGAFLRRFADDNAVLARWAFYPKTADETLTEFVGMEVVSKRAPLKASSLKSSAKVSADSPPIKVSDSDATFDSILSAASREATPSLPAAPLSPKEESPSQAELLAAQGQLLEQLLNTVVLCAENIVRMRDKLDAIDRKLSRASAAGVGGDL